MRKLILDCETLRVQSFVPRERAAGTKGTVRALSEAATQYCQPTDHHLWTCGVSCVDECDATVNDPVCFG